MSQLTDKLTLHDFAGVYGRSVCHLPYEVSFRLQAEKSGTVVHTQSVATAEGNGKDDVQGVRQSLIMPYNVLEKGNSGDFS